MDEKRARQAEDGEAAAAATMEAVNMRAGVFQYLDTQLESLAEEFPYLPESLPRVEKYALVPLKKFLDKLDPEARAQLDLGFDIDEAVKVLQEAAKILKVVHDNVSASAKHRHPDTSKTYEALAEMQ